MSNVAALPPLDERVPKRSPCLQDESWLISLCLYDRQLIRLMRHLHRVHNVITVGQFDAAGWGIVNTYSEKIPAAKMAKFFRELGKKDPEDLPLRSNESATILPFKGAQP